MFLLAPLLQHFDETLWLKCHIQWLYLAVHGCKTYLNMNLNTVKATAHAAGSDYRVKGPGQVQAWPATKSSDCSLVVPAEAPVRTLTYGRQLSRARHPAGAPVCSAASYMRQPNEPPLIHFTHSAADRRPSAVIGQLTLMT
jgi:hypothetical protein